MAIGRMQKDLVDNVIASKALAVNGRVFRE
jgi:hypothetical protein